MILLWEQLQRFKTQFLTVAECLKVLRWAPILKECQVSFGERLFSRDLPVSVTTGQILLGAWTPRHYTHQRGHRIVPWQRNSLSQLRVHYSAATVTCSVCASRSSISARKILSHVSSLYLPLPSTPGVGESTGLSCCRSIGVHNQPKTATLLVSKLPLSTKLKSFLMGDTNWRTTLNVEWSGPGRLGILSLSWRTIYERKCVQTHTLSWWKG